MEKEVFDFNGILILIVTACVIYLLINMSSYFISKRNEVRNRATINAFNSAMMIATEMMDEILDSHRLTEIISYRKSRSSDGELTELDLQQISNIIISRIFSEMSYEMKKEICRKTPDMKSTLDIKVRAALYRLEHGRRNPY